MQDVPGGENSRGRQAPPPRQARRPHHTHHKDSVHQHIQQAHPEVRTHNIPFSDVSGGGVLFQTLVANTRAVPSRAFPFEVTTTQPPSQQHHGTRVLMDYQTVMEALAAERQHVVRPADTTPEPNLWLERADWETHQRSLDCRMLRDLVAAPSSHETVVLAAVRSLGRVTNAVREYARHSTDQAALFELSRPLPSESAKRPFRPHAQEPAQERYSRHWLVELQDKQVAEQAVTEVQAAIEVGGGAYNSVVLSALTAGAVREDGWWETALNCTLVYSRLIRIARLVILHHACHMAARDWEADAAAPPAARQILLVVDHVMAMMRRLVLDTNRPGSYVTTPLASMISTRAYGMTIRWDPCSGGGITWQGDSLYLPEGGFAMEDFRRMIQSELQSAVSLARALAHGELERAAGSPALPEVPLSTFRHDRANETEYVLRRIIDPDTRTVGKGWGSTGPDGRVDWDAKQIRGYHKAANELLGMLLVLIHLTGGVPARRTETTAIRRHNTAAGSLRDIFLSAGIVSIVPPYHKNHVGTGNGRVAHRLLLREAEATEEQVADGDTPWDGSRRLDGLKTTTAGPLGTPFGMRAMRHGMIAMLQLFLRDPFQGDRAAGESDNDGEGGGESDSESGISDGGVEDDGVAPQAARSRRVQDAISVRPRDMGTVENEGLQQRSRTTSIQWRRLLGFRGQVSNAS
ncbi:hypothetical protein CSUB01_09890 [Colletotrichum sublineola]|uniref:Uncharacterized protein n=1 Tax=Colletotrichum sublineola TaxID=1173701 RepID=A0A066XK96_COLSU|nr:hypothetical protein CSUB01_09890 [Colletotrichum sublineola]